MLLVGLIAILWLLHHLSYALVVICLSVLLSQRLLKSVLVYSVDLRGLILLLLTWELRRCDWLVILLLVHWGLWILHLLLVGGDVGGLEVGPHISILLRCRLRHGAVLLLLGLHLRCLLLKFHFVQNQL